MRRHPLADKASLSGVRRAIRAELNRAGVDPSLSFDCLVAVTEACTNAIVHGGIHDDRPPEIGWEIDRAEVRFYVRDFSTQEWSRRAHPSRRVVVNGDVADRVGGFGLELMRNLMDEVQIATGAGGTTVELVKRIGRS